MGLFCFIISFATIDIFFLALSLIVFANSLMSGSFNITFRPRTRFVVYYFEGKR